MSLPWFVTLSMVLNLTWHKHSTSTLFVGALYDACLWTKDFSITSLKVLHTWCFCWLCYFMAHTRVQWMQFSPLMLSIFCHSCFCKYNQYGTVKTVLSAKNIHLFGLYLMGWPDVNIHPSFSRLFSPVPSSTCVSILGMHLFGCKFGSEKDEDTVPDRKNFDSLLWAIVTVFQVSMNPCLLLSFYDNYTHFTMANIYVSKVS